MKEHEKKVLEIFKERGINDNELFLSAMSVSELHTESHQDVERQYVLTQYICSNQRRGRYSSKG